jgi:hypothetical protein
VTVGRRRGGREPLGASVRGFAAMAIWTYANDAIEAAVRKLERDPGVRKAYVDELRETWLDVGEAGRGFADWRRQQVVSAGGNGGGDSLRVVSISGRLPLGTGEAALRLRLSERRVRQLCESGQLEAVKRGQWWVDPAGLEFFITTRNEQHDGKTRGFEGRQQEAV